MERIVKVFCTGAEQATLAEQHQVVERYKGFVLLQVPEGGMKALAQTYPIEDITDQYTIQVGARTIDTRQPRLSPVGKWLAHPIYKGVKALSPGRHHHLVQFVGPIKKQWLQAVGNAGGQPRAPQSNFTYVVRSDEKALKKIVKLPFVRWVGHLPHLARIAPSVLGRIGRLPGEAVVALPRTRKLPNVYTVEFFGSADVASAISTVTKLGFRVLTKNTKSRMLVVSAPQSGAASGKRIEALAAVHGVRSIHERSLKRTSNDVASGIMGGVAAMGNPGLGLSGLGERVAVCDTGLDTGLKRLIHQDFAGRVAWIKSYPITPDLAPFIDNPGSDDGPADLDSGHGTHVAGSVLGDGTVSKGVPGAPTIRGLAYKARLLFQAVEQEMKWKPQYLGESRYILAGIPNDLTVLFGDAYKKKAKIHSNSWGGGDPGAYDEQCEQLDRFVWEHKDFCVVVAAGNDGTDKDGDGKINPMSVTSPGTAKNCITVGACENRRSQFSGQTYGAWWPEDYPVPPFRDDPMSNNPQQVVAFSSRGPTQDGRVKPDVIAPGTFILSTRSTQIALNNTAWAPFPLSSLYFYMGGTSMATPLTAGAVALVREYLRKRKKIANPTAALLKATLIAGATRLAGYGPASAVVDTHQGYGSVNLDAVLAPSAPTKVRFNEVKPGLESGDIRAIQVKLKSGSAPLRVVLAYSDYPGASLVNNLNLLVTAPDGRRYAGNQAAGGSLTLDVRNNVELVHINAPAVGRWKIEVIGSNIPQGPQDYALVYMGNL